MPTPQGRSQTTTVTFLSVITSIPPTAQSFSPMQTLYHVFKFNPNAQTEHAQEVEGSETFATRFYLQILNPCIDQLPIETKTRISNLVKMSSKTQTLPTYYRIYEQDTPALSSSIGSMFVTNDAHPTYLWYM